MILLEICVYRVYNVYTLVKPKSECRGTWDAPMIDRSELLRTTKAILILVVVFIGITAIVVGFSKWTEGDGPRIVIQSPR